MARESKRRAVNAEGKHDHVRRQPSSHATASLNGSTRHEPSLTWSPLGSVRDLHHFSLIFRLFSILMSGIAHGAPVGNHVKECHWRAGPQSEDVICK